MCRQSMSPLGLVHSVVAHINRNFAADPSCQLALPSSTKDNKIYDIEKVRKRINDGRHEVTLECARWYCNNMLVQFA